MPSSAGPNTAGESNLAFAYDSGDVINSYKGEPSTNLALFSMNGSFSSDYPSNITFTDDSTVTYQGRQSKRVVATGQWNIYRYPRSGNYTATSSGQFTYSFKIKWADGHTPYFSNGYIYVDASTTYPGITVRAIGNGWFWCYCTYNGTSSPPWLTGFTTTDTGTCWIVDWQLEAGLLHPTPYIAPGGTRSVTQGLLPLAGTNTINLTDMSFDSNAQMTFDGTNDYITVTNTPSLVPTSTTSWEFILQPTSTSGYRAIFQKSNYGNSTGFIALFMNPASLAFRLNASDVAESTRALDHNFNGNITLNAYTHIVLTYNGVVFTLYINGVPTNTGAWSYGLGTNQGDLLIGTFWAGPWAGNMPIAKQYNTALTQAQITQNYLAYKTRFNLT